MNSEEHRSPDFSVLLKKIFLRLDDLHLLQRRKVFTFFFFVLISAAFWFVRSLGEEYEDEVSYPIRYINFPDNKVLVGQIPDKLQLRLRAKGFLILRSKLNLNLAPLKFNVSSFSLNSIGPDTFYVVTEKVMDLLSAELNQVTILDISPDTLFFRFMDIEVKKAAVRPLLSLHDKFYQKQFMQNGNIIVSPDSIIVSGPAMTLRNLQSISTEMIYQTNLADTITVECNLKPVNMVTFSQQTVKVTIPVDRFTEVDDNLSVVPLNVPDSLNMIAIPGQVTVTYNICLTNYNKLAKSPLVPRIDYQALQGTQKSRLNVFLTDTPEIISNIRFNPKEIEFLITRK